jgi:two-component system, response regulator RegA
MQPNLRILMRTGFASIATAMGAMKRGATHSLPKPADADEIPAALFGNAGCARTCQQTVLIGTHRNA